MKKILISLHPDSLAKILSGEMPVDLKINIPKAYFPCEVYLYCTKTHDFGYLTKEFAYNSSNKAIVRQFKYHRVLLELHHTKNAYQVLNGSIVGKCTLRKCKKTDYDSYTWNIDNLKIFVQPKKLQDFGYERPPQSWGYIGDSR